MLLGLGDWFCRVKLVNHSIFENPVKFFLTAGEPFKIHSVQSLIHYLKKRLWQYVSRTCVPSVSYYIVFLFYLFISMFQESPMLPLSGVNTLWSLKSAISLNFLITIVFVLNVYVCVIWKPCSQKNYIYRFCTTYQLRGRWS